MSTFFITGVAGFIGSNLAQGLISRGHRVVGVDNFMAGKQENVEEVGSKLDFHRVDIRDLQPLREVMEGADYVLHHAAMASVPWSVEEPALANEHNVTGTLNVLLAARDLGVKRVVMAATSAVYGNTESLPAREDQPLETLSPYAATKLMGEHYLSLFHRVYGLPTVGLRYFNVYGRRQDPGSAYAAAIPIFVSKILAGEAPTIFGDGRQTRDFVHVDDVLEANINACEAGPEANGLMFNIGTGQRITVNHLCARIAQLLGSDLEAVHGPDRAGDARHSVADISLAKKVLGFSPEYDVDRGLEEAIGWYRENL